MIHSARMVPKGSLVELRRGVHVILARVVWKDGGRIGLQSRERLPIEEILSLSQVKARQLVAVGGVGSNRRRATSPSAALIARVLEFIGICGIVVSLAVGAWTISQSAFARPIAAIATALGDQG